MSSSTGCPLRLAGNPLRGLRARPPACPLSVRRGPNAGRPWRWGAPFFSQAGVLAPARTVIPDKPAKE
eukprot:8443269-Alexandrium_andersonii.AAC.1